jgi:flagellar biosynthesis component FlhA
MIRKTITIDEEDYYKICNQLERIYVDVGQAFIHLYDKEKTEEILKRISHASYWLLKELGWTE